ncbi:MAG: hypothetical protein LWW85_06220 [Marinilabiliales bacterium]|nr:hypothetical protein [Marinilabiliales bacterium]
MQTNFHANNQELAQLIETWVPKLLKMESDLLTDRRNGQDRNIRQIVGHMVDSATNNIHRLVHFQYQPDPMVFPDYANLGNNDRWIAIQHYEEEDWQDLVMMWKFLNLHFIHVVRHLNPECLHHTWFSATGEPVVMEEMVVDYLRHFRLHLDEISELAG